MNIFFSKNCWSIIFEQKNYWFCFNIICSCKLINKLDLITIKIAKFLYIDVKEHKKILLCSTNCETENKWILKKLVSPVILILKCFNEWVKRCSLILTENSQKIIDYNANNCFSHSGMTVNIRYNFSFFNWCENL